MKILIIDGQSGRLGAQLIEALAARLPMDQHQLIAIGANSLATSAMLKAGAQQGATGENPVLVACRDADIIAGPIGIVNEIGKSVQAGFLDLLYLTALIAVNLGVFNLLPFPALDGGRVFFLLVELIRRKPIPPEKEGFVHMIGMGLLLLLMLVVTYQDILKFFT